MKNGLTSHICTHVIIQWFPHSLLLWIWSIKEFTGFAALSVVKMLGSIVFKPTQNQLDEFLLLHGFYDQLQICILSNRSTAWRLRVDSRRCPRWPGPGLLGLAWTAHGAEEQDLANEIAGYCGVFRCPAGHSARLRHNREAFVSTC